MLRVLFNSDFFKLARFTKVKSPAEIVIGTVRLAKDFSLPSPHLIDLARQCQYMGQEIYNPPTVEGWHTGQEWIDSGTLVERVNFLSSQLGDITKKGVREIARRPVATDASLSAEELVDGCVAQLGGVPITPETRRTLTEFVGNGDKISTGDADFISKTATVLGVISATKEYQLN